MPAGITPTGINAFCLPRNIDVWVAKALLEIENCQRSESEVHSIGGRSDPRKAERLPKEALRRHLS
jgi:hypothetical protein